MIPMKNIRELSNSYRNIQEAKFDVSKGIKDLGGNFAGSNEDQMKAVQLLKGLALSDDPKANEFMEKLDAATSQISKEMSESHHDYDKKKKVKKEEVETVEESKTLIDLLNNIKNGGKIEDIDLTEEEINGILDFYENTLDSTGQNEFNKMSITKIQSTMKKLGL